MAGFAARVPAEGGIRVASDYVRVTGLAGLFAEARELSVRTMIFDVEPLVAPWNSSQEALDQGIARRRTYAVDSASPGVARRGTGCP